MIGFRILAFIAAATLLGARTAPPRSHDVELARGVTWPKPAGALSVMSYNIKGLPWPLAAGREAATSAIGQRLAAMRSDKAQPHVVLLQEAFGDRANTLNKAAGYPYVVIGPQVSRPDARHSLGPAFAADAQWVKGEQSGSLIDSGLAVLSDYPVIKIERYAFPEGACAGYDCLAAKGVFVAWIDVPDAGEPIAVVNTHLNSRRATRVTSQRADRAYAWQVAAVREFLSGALPSGTPVIFGGDFNTGQAPARLTALSRPLIDDVQVDGLKTVLSENAVILGSAEEARRIISRNKDRILFREGARVAVRAERAWVPFPVNARRPLSDHAGFVIDFSLER